MSSMSPTRIKFDEHINANGKHTCFSISALNHEHGMTMEPLKNPKCKLRMDRNLQQKKLSH